MNVYIGVGSNINSERNIIKALRRLIKNVEITGISTFYHTKPILREEEQDDYLNGVWQVNTSLSPQELKMNVLKQIEQHLHRTGLHDKFAPRTIDLDLLLFDDHIINEENLTIPDPDIYNRPFIAFPLHELNPNLVLPDTNTPIATVKDSLSKDGLKPNLPFTYRLKKVFC